MNRVELYLTNGKLVLSNDKDELQLPVSNLDPTIGIDQTLQNLCKIYTNLAFSWLNPYLIEAYQHDAGITLRYGTLIPCEHQLKAGFLMNKTLPNVHRELMSKYV